MKRLELMIDCGAYSAFKLGGRVDLGHYIEFLKRNEEWIAHHISLDVIPGSRHNEREIKRAADFSYRQHRVMKREGLSPIPVLHETSLLALGNWMTVNQRSRGNIQQGRQAYPWFDRCFSVLREYPEVKVHGLGMSTPMALERYPWSSVSIRVPGSFSRKLHKFLVQSFAAAAPIIGWPTILSGSEYNDAAIISICWVLRPVPGSRSISPRNAEPQSRSAWMPMAASAFGSGISMHSRPMPRSTSSSSPTLGCEIA